MLRTEDLIKRPIERLAAERYGAALRVPKRGARAYPLPVGGRTYRADFAYRLPDDAWLFVEDDDAARAVANVAKYWRWLDAAPAGTRAHLVHLIGPRGPGAIELASFVSEQVPASLLDYRPIAVEDWHGGAWLDALTRTLDAVVRDARAGGDGEPKPLGPLRDDPAIGMWKDREDMHDSTAWVRALRRSEWERRR